MRMGSEIQWGKNAGLEIGMGECDKKILGIGRSETEGSGSKCGGKDFGDDLGIFALYPIFSQQVCASHSLTGYVPFWFVLTSIPRSGKLVR
jgi:hypothetical protein